MNINDFAHEIWASAQLLPDEGIEDGVQRIIDILKNTPCLYMSREGDG